jgi:hypothetical protein
LVTHSLNVQDKTAAAAAVLVVTNAFVANPSAASADPALNPNQPTQRRDAPMTENGRLWGGIGSVPYPTRFPKMIAQARAEIPELM